MDKLIISPREFNRLVRLNAIDSNYLINCDISEEKDALVDYINDLEKTLEVANHNKNEFYGMLLKEKKYSKSLEKKSFNIISLVDIIKKQREIIDFYSKKENWRKNGPTIYGLANSEDVEEINHQLKYGGKIARDFQRENNKLINGILRGI